MRYIERMGRSSTSRVGKDGVIVSATKSAGSLPLAPPGPPAKLEAPKPLVETDKPRLPQGECRYILLLPEIKGHRCACVGFSLNRTMPSLTCDCGHLACFHLKNVKLPADEHEIDTLKQRIQALEEQLG